VFYDNFPLNPEKDSFEKNDSEEFKETDKINNANFSEENQSKILDNEMGGDGESGGTNNGGESETGNNNEEFLLDESNRELACMLIRPGNLPDISCSVNHIYVNETSIKIKNEIGKELGVIIKIENCYPEISEIIENNQEKDFIFSCNNKKNYFSEIISISYITESGEIDIGGFIQGPVESY
jgi:hypothetical protein